VRQPYPFEQTVLPRTPERTSETRTRRRRSDEDPRGPAKEPLLRGTWSSDRPTIARAGRDAQSRAAEAETTKAVAAKASLHGALCRCDRGLVRAGLRRIPAAWVDATRRHRPSLRRESASRAAYYARSARGPTCSRRSKLQARSFSLTNLLDISSARELLGTRGRLRDRQAQQPCGVRSRSVQSAYERIRLRSAEAKEA